MGIDDYDGFEIDGNHRFVLGDFTVTHNTVMGLKIISLLKKKTLIIVHKEFLMNQWIERITEFLPTATVGKIQGQVFDVKGNDIVIGMVQTLYDKEYPADAFSCFGLTIIDEVHRIGSEQFSRTLFKTITPYMLGISATVDRKDKLTKVLYMFIGDKIYSETRQNDDPVCVRAIQYETDDPVFNETELDFRGNPKYSSMIVKLCDYNRRSDFIVKIIGDLIKEEPEKQIMVLCHNRSLLTYLYDGIEHRKIASVGYYVGGMKQANLQQTETKQIVLATYAMAAEALDIKNLSTLVMVTPKTDITQSVGRILRVKHKKPIIVDIIDSHDIFQNQWAQRKRFYKKSNYRIREIDSKKYVNMMIDWEEDKTWKRVFEPKEKDNNSCGNTENEEKEQKTIFGGKCLINIDNL
jgi:superfamily II DNA or RNA helicase